MHTSAALRLGITLVAIATIVTGCRRSKENDDGVLVGLELIRERANRGRVPSRMGKRAELAISMRTNGVLDPTPLVICPFLNNGDSAYTVGMHIYDEDEDTIGLGVRETRVGENGTEEILVEEYPAYLHRPLQDALSVKLAPVRIRDAGQRKDDALWHGYVSGEGIDVARSRNFSYYRETCPPIWISLPEPNVVDVEIYVYDRAGNKSEPVPLINRLGEQLQSAR